MNKVTKPQLPISGTAFIKTKSDYLLFIANWKRVVKRDSERDYGSTFASLMIFRNLAIGSDTFKGFTPSQKINVLKNGRTFLSGWLDAYDLLCSSINRVKQDSDRKSNLIDDLKELMDGISDESMNDFNNIYAELVQPVKYSHLNSRSYTRWIHDHLVTDIASGEHKRVQTITEILNHYDGKRETVEPAMEVAEVEIDRQAEVA